MRRTRPSALKLRDRTNVIPGSTPKTRHRRESATDSDSPKLNFPVRKRLLSTPSESTTETKTKRRRNAQCVDQQVEDEMCTSPSDICIQRAQSLSVLEISSSSIFLDASFSSPDNIENYSLTTVGKPQVPHQAFRSISGETLCKLLFSMSAEQFCRKYILVDCRYPYEYSGGHIRNAINLFDARKLESIFYPSDEDAFREVSSKIPIFYCEYSQKRGPGMALELRSHDRRRNHYPNVDYKEIYVLDRGYKRFYGEGGFKEFCEPDGYIEMNNKDYCEELKRHLKISQAGNGGGGQQQKLSTRQGIRRMLSFN